MRLRLLPDMPELGWTPYAWLIYLSIFLGRPLTRDASAAEWAATAAGVAVFLVLYFWGFWIRDMRILWIVGGLALLGAVFAPFNSGSNVFFVYAASFLGYGLRPAVAIRWIGVLVLMIVVLSWALDLTSYFWIPGIVFTVFIGGVNLHFAEVSRGYARERAFQEEAERLAQTAERERIARDLHDLLGHTLSVITLKSELAAKLVSRDPERAGQEMREVERISRESLREVRSAIAGYRTEGVAGEMARVRLALEAAGVKLESFVMPVELGPMEETVLSLALREAVTNVIRHAGARTCRISLEPVDGAVRLEVRDDGRGSRAPEGMGLSAMRDRVEGLGGSLERRLDNGTVITVTLPPRQAAEAWQEHTPAVLIPKPEGAG